MLKRIQKPGRYLMVALLFLLSGGAVYAQTTPFTYQGRLSDGGTAANGNYDLQFKLFDTADVGTGTQQPQPNPLTVTLTNVGVSAGIFTVQLDFGASAFSGANRFLEISARLAGTPSFTTLAPRQPITSTPYAVRSLNASSADTATNASQLGGAAASQYVQTNDSRLSDPRSPTSGSPSYIQNSATQQTASNFSISGNGLIGGNVGIGTATPATRLTLTGGPSWTSGGWMASMNLQNASALGWEANASGQRFGIGQLGGGLYFFRTNSAFGNSSSPASYDMVIADTGRVGINTTTPRSKLDVNGNSATCGVAVFSFGNPFTPSCTTVVSIFSNDPSNTNLIEARSITSTLPFVVTGSSQVGVGVSNPQRLLHVNGRARVGSIPLEQSFAHVCFNQAGDLLQCDASSLKLKNNVRPFRSGLNVIRRLKPISYNWREGGAWDFGLGAEDVAKIAPQLTFYDAENQPAGVKYEKISMLLINAIKQQQEQIETLRAQNTALNARLRSVEKIVRKRLGPSRRRR